LLYLLVFCLAFGGIALADARMPLMPAPPTTPVYWQLTRIALEPSVAPAGGYEVRYETAHLPLDLSDPLMLESQLASGESDFTPQITITIQKGETAMAHTYRWTALPVYLTPNTTYPISLTAEGETPAYEVNSLLGAYMQGEPIARISAGAYTGHPAAAEWVIDTAKAPYYIDGSLVLSFVLRDVNDMFRLRVEYTYEMAGGAKPMPTPVPGFVAVPVEPGVVPSYYIAVPGQDGLWTITTQPEQYRAYGVMTGEGPNFFPADANGAVRMDEPPVTPEADYAQYVEGFVPWMPDTVPAVYSDLGDGLYGLITRDGETLLRAYGRINGGAPAFYSADAITQSDAAPIDPAADYETFVRGFGAAAADALPPHYRLAAENLYALTTRDGQTIYRVYGRLDGAEPAFYASDDQGNLLDPAPVDPDADFIAYIKGFTPATPDAIPAFYEKVGDALYALTDREGNPVYRAYGVKDGAAPAWYAADAAGQVAEDAAPIAEAADFEAYIAGFEPIAMADAPYYYELTEQDSLFSFVDLSGAVQYRAYGSLNRGEAAYYPADANGAVAPDALPVQPAADLMSMPAPTFRAQAAPAELLPAFYAPVEETTGLYSFADREGNPVYRLYGGYGRQMPQFYPATAQGLLAEGAEAIDPAQDFVDYIEGFAPATPDVIPAFYKKVIDALYELPDREGDPVYRIYGAYDRGAPAFYPADAEGNPIESMPPVAEVDDYTAYVEGFVPAMPDEMPTYYRVIDATAGLYAFDGRDWETVYRVFGAVDRGVPAFYPSDAAGVPTDTLPVNPDDEIALLPTPYARSIATVVPVAPSPETLTRGGALPLSTQYAAQVQPLPGESETAAPITREAEANATDASREASAQVSVEATELTVPPIASPQASISPLPLVTAEFPAPTASPVPAEPTAAPTEAVVAETATAAPTAAAVATEAATEAPAPTPLVTESPTDAPVVQEASGGGIGWWIGGIAVLALGGAGFAVYKKRKR
jgi:hypothetical protein